MSRKTMQSIRVAALTVLALASQSHTSPTRNNSHLTMPGETGGSVNMRMHNVKATFKRRLTNKIARKSRKINRRRK